VDIGQGLVESGKDFADGRRFEPSLLAPALGE
jgi:hypothetical protein